MSTQKEQGCQRKGRKTVGIKPITKIFTKKKKAEEKMLKRLEILSLYPIILNVRGTFYLFISIY
jgi:hypothetical protein